MSSCKEKTSPLASAGDAADAGVALGEDGATAIVGPQAEEEKDAEPSTAGLAPAIPVHEGSAVALAREGDRLYIADEDHSTLRILPLDPNGTGYLPYAKSISATEIHPHESITLPGPPANIVVTATSILVTVRDPGLLLVFKREGAKVVETSRVPLPADAWGLAVSPDETTAVVTSAWTHKVSSIDLRATPPTALFTVDVGREPRGVVVRADGGGAYVSHLVSTTGDLTRIDNLRSDKPKVQAVKLPVARLRTHDKELRASLGYALALSQDGRRLFAPRHALGAVGDQAWFGAGTIDVLLTTKDEPLAPRRTHGGVAQMKDGPPHRMVDADGGPFPTTATTSFIEPRTVSVVGDKLFVLSEGNNAIYTASATVIDPSLAVETTSAFGCKAAAGMAVAPDGQFAWVFCRAPYNLEAVALSGTSLTHKGNERLLAKDALSSEAAEGRAIFHDASDSDVSGGLACAGCHPEGRDDGHVWHEIETRSASFTVPSQVEPRVFAGGEDVAGVKGFPRQTPMLAGRVKSEGPYGWHAENPDLRSRIEEGIHLHRWNAGTYNQEAMAKASKSLAAFLRQGLVTPPREKRALTAVELQGKKLFESDETACATCHAPAKDFTDRAPRVLKPWPPANGFDDEQPGSGYKPPSLLFIAGTAPYYHDGSSATLEDLIADNKDRMGKTSQLNAEERAALVAYLKTL